MTGKLVLIMRAALSIALFSEAFLPSPRRQRPSSRPLVADASRVGRSALWAAAGEKKRRRRKQPPAAPGSPESSVTPEPMASMDDSASEEDLDDDDEDEINISMLKDIASYKFDGEIAVSDTSKDSAPAINSLSLPLPDIKDTLRKKELEEEMARIEEEESSSRVKIKRSDRKAMAKLLEQDPYADADDSFFEEEEYGTVSALLGERALPFLGIPTGPLQVGHFIGALVIVLMAFVEYPGFPLTNLPSPLRGSLQGGLLSVYSINAVLAVLSIFKASERGQPAPLWVMKTFTVGGLAFDQLTQLPTLEQLAEMKSRKGKRALKNRRK